MARAAAQRRTRGADAVERQGLADLVHEKTKALIFDRSIAPGERIKIDQLARRLDVSISPVREALARLLSERLVMFEPFVGYSAAPLPEPRFFTDMLDLRIVLEGYAARLGAPQRNPAILKRLEQAMKGRAFKGEGPNLPRRKQRHGAPPEWLRWVLANRENHGGVHKKQGGRNVGAMPFPSGIMGDPVQTQDCRWFV